MNHGDTCPNCKIGILKLNQKGTLLECKPRIADDNRMSKHCNYHEWK